jgi:hypothetical protein
VWQGLYSYPRKLDPVSFVATLIETANSISGSVHEPAPARFGSGTIFAALLGHRSAHAVAVIKTYLDGVPHGRPVHYEGALRDDGSEIEGCWVISPQWSGRFLMIRSRRNAEAIARKKYERVRL